MDLKLNGKVALVTGATRGIGRAIIELLSDEGCHIAFCARKPEEVDSCRTSISSKGVKCYAQAVDVFDADSFKGFIDDAAAELGGLDIFVSNVTGGNEPGDAGWVSQFKGNVLAAVHGVEASQPYLEKSGNGSIIMIATTAALEYFMSAGPYSAMKAALLNYSGNLACELAPKGIRVNAVSPGPIFVEGGAWDRVKQTMPELYESTVAKVPLGRLGSGREVATQVALLASPLSSFTTGTNVVIDGSFTRRVQY
ncbi:MAG: SDR family oxidoreductase [Gammaproteobacteria bacterium]|nr:SDR family oxidoreductase [Pseudomonadales bacterium]MCP5346147.1 SDR family oxidoreductase [Pseudomonadales bacterium]